MRTHGAKEASVTQSPPPGGAATIDPAPSVHLSWHRTFPCKFVSFSQKVFKDITDGSGLQTENWGPMEGRARAWRAGWEVATLLKVAEQS